MILLEKSDSYECTRGEEKEGDTRDLRIINEGIFNYPLTTTTKAFSIIFLTQWDWKKNLLKALKIIDEIFYFFLSINANFSSNLFFF